MGIMGIMLFRLLCAIFVWEK